MNALILFCLCIGLSAQTATVQPSAHESKLAANNADELQAGAVVEAVAPNSEAKKADLRNGDLLLYWSRENSHGAIQSPFDLSWIEIEQKPKGPVRVKGLRNGRKLTWVLGPDRWGIDARPNLHGGFLSAYRRSKDLIEAGKLSEALAVCRSMAEASTSSPWLGAWLLFHAGNLLADKQRHKDADAVYQKAIKQAQDAGPVAATQIFRAWGKSFASRNDWANAESRYRQAIAESRKVSDENMAVAASLNNLGIIADNSGDLVNAKEYYLQTLAMRRKLAPGSLDVANTLNNLGTVALDQGDLGKAEQYYLQALSKEEKLSPRSLEAANILNNLGVVFRQRGELAKAEVYYRRTLDIDEALDPDSLDAAKSLSNLGVVAGNRGDVAKAEEYFRQAFVIDERLAPGSLDMARALSNLGEVARQHGDLAKAEEYRRQALAIYEKLAPGRPDVAENLHDLGDVFAQRGDLAKAEQYYGQALTTAERISPGSLDVAGNLNNLGEVFARRGYLDKAEEYQRRALAIYTRLAPGSTVQAETEADLAGISLKKQQWKTAAQLYSQALNALESQTAQLGGSNEVRLQFRARHALYYSDYIDLQMQQHKPELAFQILERSRAQSLREMLANAHIHIRQGVDPHLLDQRQLLQATINTKADQRIDLLTGEHTDEQVKALSKELDGLLEQYEEVEGQIRVSSPNYAVLTQPRPLTAKQIQQQLLDPDTMLLEYALGEKRSYLFALSSDSFAAYELPSRAKIETAARRIYDSVTKGVAGYTEASAELSRMVLGPVASQLSEKRLLIASDGALEYVPFAILPAPGKTTPTPLIVEHEIVYLPSASALADLHREAAGRKPAPFQVAVLADPVFSADDTRVRHSSLAGARLSNASTTREVSIQSALVDSGDLLELSRAASETGISRNGNLGRLPFSRKEAEAIYAIAGPKNTAERLDFDASRTNALSPELQRYRIVHFATHGLINSEHPELSGLAFSLVDRKGQPQNGFLRLLDIYNMRLNADLVVLSACQTALGKEVQGEGLVGLTRGFMYAGAPRVMASLWNADDIATAELMKEFYRAMYVKHMRPAAALRAAQIRMWTQTASPYYWGAFVLQGEWK